MVGVIDRFIEGIVAGYGIAIPVGAISILILEISLSRGLAVGFAAGAGAASADFIFAGLAALAGKFLTDLLLPIHTPIQVLSGVFLILLGAWGILRLRNHHSRTNETSSGLQNPTRIYIQFLILTLLNPLTLAYFSALILAREAVDEPTARIAFVLGAGLASLSWQSFLAFVGAKAMGKFSDQFQRITIVIGNLIVIGIGLIHLRSLLR